MNSAELIPNGVPLADVPGLTAAQIETLKNAWLLTAQELVALDGANAALRGRLAAALKLSPPALAEIVAGAKGLIPGVRDLHTAEMEEAAAQAEYGLGALLDEPDLDTIERLPCYEPPSRAVLPESVSLLDQLPPVRNQGSRGTCVAHAVLAVREQLELAAHSPAELNLSEQYVYWWCKAHDNIPKVSGTYISVGMRCLTDTGAPLETIWPYVSFEQDDQGQGPPPEAAAAGDPAFCTLQTQKFNRTDIEGIKTCLNEGRAVAFSIPVYDSWYASAATSRWGKITLPLAGEPQNGGHAMALVGYQDDADAPGGGYFLVRNSWQPWAWDGAWRSGYGYIPYAYIKRHASAVYSATRIAGAEVALRDRADEAGPRAAELLTWLSPDVWSRHAADGGTEHQPVQPGQPNALYVRAFNRGPAYAYGVRAEIFYAPAAPHIRPGEWQRIGHVTARWLPPGETVLGPLSWTPPAAEPYSLLARLATAEQRASDTFDPAASSLVAQRNAWEAAAQPGEPVEIAFLLAGAAGQAGAVSLHVIRGELPAAVEVTPIRVAPTEQEADTTPTRGIVDTTVLGALSGGVMLAAGESRRASLTITLPSNAAPGDTYAFAIEQRQGTARVGRLAVELRAAEMV